ncbi:hypothetical protein QZH41_017686, partial [Actinostola sp. cb2023]
DISVDLSFNTFHMINDGVIRGSCPEYETRKDITSELRGTTRQCLVSLQEAMERWGDRLVIVASQDMRDSAVIGEGMDPNVTINTFQFCVLEHVGQSRACGRLQRFMAAHFHCDAKSFFFHLKTFNEKGFIRKEVRILADIEVTLQ